MLSTDLHDAAVALGRAVRATPELIAYRTADEALDADPVAEQLLVDLRDQQLALGRLQQAGLSPSGEQIAALRLCQDAVRANPTIMAHLRAANDVKRYLPTVALEVSAALGTDYARFVAPQTC